MVEPVQPEPGEDELRGRNVLDATYTCTDILGSGGQSICWYAADKEYRGVAVKVFRIYPGGDAFEEELRIYRTLGLGAQDPPHPHLVRMLDYKANGKQIFEKPIFQRDRAYIVFEEISGGDLLNYCSRV